MLSSSVMKMFIMVMELSASQSDFLKKKTSDFLNKKLWEAGDRNQAPDQNSLSILQNYQQQKF